MLAHGHEHLRRHGQNILFALEQDHELGQHEGEHEDGGHDGEDHDDERVDHGPDDLPLGLGLLGQVVVDAAEHVAEGSREFAGPDHVDVEQREDLGKPLNGFRELPSGLDVALEGADDGDHAGVDELVADAFEGRGQADAGFRHDAELAREGEEVLGADAVEDGEPPGLGGPLAVGHDAGQVEDDAAEFAELLCGQGLVVGREGADDHLAVALLHLVPVRMHRSPRLRARGTVRPGRARGRVRCRG